MVKIQHMKTNNNYYIYVPRKTIKDLNLKVGEDVDITITKKT